MNEFLGDKIMKERAMKEGNVLYWKLYKKYTTWQILLIAKQLKLNASGMVTFIK